MTGIDGRDCCHGYVFPLAGMCWADFRHRPEIRGADDGEPGRAGWHYARSASHRHRGMDLKAPIGLPVLAVIDGRAQYVASALDAAGRPLDVAGHRVRLAGRDGAGYRYVHLGTDGTDPGDAFPPGVVDGDFVDVRTGDVLGYVGHTGGSEATGIHMPAAAAHLHFQYHPDGLDGPDANPARFFERFCPTHAALPSPGPAK